MRFKVLTLVCLLTWLACPVNSYATFIAKREQYKNFSGKTGVVMIASTGRSGSTMLTEQIQKYLPSKKVLKTHLLPPAANFQGKIIFIFSNPDQAAESALYMSLHYKKFAQNHFSYVETVDHEWVAKMGGPLKQNKQDNLLSYDGLGVYEHLKVWLHTGTTPTDVRHAQILAIKYENLWDQETLQAIRTFLDTSHFKLPAKRPRGHDELTEKEVTFRKLYNLGTEDDPRYAAYDDARSLWEQAPPFQFLKIVE